MVAKPFDWIVLGAFLLTSFVAAEAFEKARREAQIAADRMREIDQLAQKADALREAALLKDAVISAVSHDLRTPLTTIKALAAEIRSDGDERAMTIEEEADRLNSMVADLLDIGRINSGAMTLQPEPNEAEDLVGAALQRVQGTAGGRQILVSLEPGEPLLIGRFDFTHTLRALVNLIENAIKYSPPTEAVELRVRRDNDWLEFSVLDRGEGIARSECEKIFEPFYRAPGFPPDIGGAGLGLSIGRALAIAQHGSLTYAPREGGGSVFSLRMPAIDVEELSQQA
jgi:two-component system sensor histidine kinase KdpD